MPSKFRVYLKFALPFLLGFLLGWLVIGWWLWPVRWVNTDPWDLRPEFKKHYILMAADSYALDHDPNVLRERFSGWPEEELSGLIEEIKRERPGDIRLASRLDEIKAALNLPEPSAPRPQAAREGRGLLPIVLALTAILLLLVAVGIAYRLFKERLPQVFARAPRRPARPTRPSPEPEPIEGEYREFYPIARYSATYSYGDIRFAESFPIESPNGDYLGECGIETSELMSSGDPPKVVAFEVWLFDKEVNRTVSKAITIPEVDEATEASLKSLSGEVIKARKGEVVKLETRNLETHVTIREVSIDPNEKFFTRLGVEFKIYRRQAAQG